MRRNSVRLKQYFHPLNLTHNCPYFHCMQEKRPLHVLQLMNNFPGHNKSSGLRNSPKSENLIKLLPKRLRELSCWQLSTSKRGLSLSFFGDTNRKTTPLKVKIFICHLPQSLHKTIYIYFFVTATTFLKSICHQAQTHAGMIFATNCNQ